VPRLVRAAVLARSSPKPGQVAVDVDVAAGAGMVGLVPVQRCTPAAAVTISALGRAIVPMHKTRRVSTTPMRRSWRSSTRSPKMCHGPTSGAAPSTTPPPKHQRGRPASCYQGVPRLVALLVRGARRQNRGRRLRGANRPLRRSFGFRGNGRRRTTALTAKRIARLTLAAAKASGSA
jgi:hypothetical protein